MFKQFLLHAKDFKRIPLVEGTVKWFLNRYAEGSVTTIRTGLAKGLKWKRFHRYANAFWVGYYEMENQLAILHHLKPGGVFYDLGANAGFFTLVASHLVGAQGRCFAFEPDPSNFALLQEHLGLNQLANCQAYCQAVADFEGKATFFFDSAGSAVGHLKQRENQEKGIEVEVGSLDRFVEQNPAPDFIKMDVEGAEGSVLDGAYNILKHHKPVWLIELHGVEAEQKVKARLLAAHYSILDIHSMPLDVSKPLPYQIIAVPNER